MINYNSLDWNEIIPRIFALYGAKTNKDLAEVLGFSEELIRRWRAPNAIKRIYPTWDTLEKIVATHGVTWDWLLTGKSEENENSPPAPASGAILPQLSRMAVELMDILNDIHLRALEGMVSEEQFQSILIAATGSLAEAARENGVAPKKAIG